jgi:hypothetical protein
MITCPIPYAKWFSAGGTVGKGAPSAPAMDHSNFNAAEKLHGSLASLGFNQQVIVLGN